MHNMLGLVCANTNIKCTSMLQRVYINGYDPTINPEI